MFLFELLFVSIIQLVMIGLDVIAFFAAIVDDHVPRGGVH